MAVQAKAQRIIDHVNGVATPSSPMTIRRIYYSLVTNGILTSSVESYNCVKSTMTAARRTGAVPYEAIIDNTRDAQSPPMWKSVQERATSAKYIRLDRWQNQNTVCEIICEKDAALPLIDLTCNTEGVTIRVLRGDASLSFLYSTAKHYSEQLNAGKSVRVGAWADFDAGGVSILKAAERGVREILDSQFDIYEPNMEWTRLGINKDQFEAYDMLPIPLKKLDTKGAAFIKEFGVAHGAEIDALPAEVITQITEDFIESCKDQKRWKKDEKFYTKEETRWERLMESISE